MPLINQAILDELLDPNNVKAKTNQPSYDKTGPARLDKWLGIIEKRENCWQKPTSQRTTPKKKKIIFTDALLKIRAPESFELDLFQAICKEYPIYLWSGEKTPISALKQVTTSDEFWAARESVQPATKQQVLEELSVQGLSADDYIILDHHAYYELINNYLNKTELKDINRSPFNFELSFTRESPQLNLSTAASFVDLKSIRSIKMEPSSKVELDFKNKIDKLEKIQISYDESGNFFPQNLNYEALDLVDNSKGKFGIFSFQDTLTKTLKLIDPDSDAIHRETDGNDIKIISDPEKPGPLNSLYFENQKIAILDADPTNQIKKLELNNCIVKTLALENFPELEELTFKSCVVSDETVISIPELIKNQKLKTFIWKKGRGIDNLDFINLNHLEKVAINNKKCQIENCPSLKSLEIVGGDFSIDDTTNIETLSLTHYTKPNSTLDLENYTKIKKLELGNYIIENIEKAKSLEELTTGKCKGVENISNLPNLRLIEFYNFNKEQTLSNLPLLEELYINNPPLQNLIIQDCPKLKKISLTTINQFEFSLPESVEELIWCNPLGISKGLDLNSCSKIKKLTLKMVEIRELDLSQFTNLQELVIKNCDGIDQLDLSALTQLKSLIIIESKIKSIITPPLEELIIERSIVNIELDDYNSVKLKKLQIKNSRLESSIFNKQDFAQPAFPKLEELVFSDVIYRDDIDLSKMPHLKRFVNRNVNFFGNEFSEFLNLNHLKNLEHLELEQKREFNLDVSSLPKLKTAKLGIRQANIFSVNNSDLRELVIHQKGDERLNLELENFPRLNKLDLSVEFDDFSISGIRYCQELNWFDFTIHGNTQKVNDWYAQNLSHLSPTCHASFKDSTTNDAVALQTPKSVLTEEEMIARDQANCLNPVSHFSLRKKLKIDSETNNDGLTYIANEDLKVVIESEGKPCLPLHYRMEVFDRVDFANGELQFVAEPRNLKLISNSLDEFDENNVKNFRQLLKTNTDLSLAHFSGNLLPGEYYPLPTREPLGEHDMTVHVNPKDAVDLFWDESHEQYYIRLKNHITSPQPVEALYLFNHDIQYENRVNNSPILANPSDLLASGLQNLLLAEIKNIPDLQFLFDSNLTPAEKLDLLATYCKFDNEDLTSSPNTDLETLIAVIKERKGACRHRAQAFMVLARLMGVPAQMIANEIHAFCEVPYPGKTLQKCSWHSFDLGGSFSYDITPAGKKVNELDKLDPTKKNTAPISNEEKTYEEKYFKQFLKLVEKSIIHSPKQLLEEDTSLPPLIELKSNQDPLVINKLILDQLKNSHLDDKHIYIHSPSDLKQYLISTRLENGSIKEVDGPLLDLIKNGGVLLINWSTFTATEIASYKSILDKEPTLLGHSVSKKLKIINLAESNTQGCSAFLSRCQHFILHSDFMKHSTQNSSLANPNTPFEIDLFHSSNWREKLFGKIKFSGDQITLENQPILDAIHQNRPLLIHNPPEDDAFKLFLYRFNTEKKILYNGQQISIPSSMQISVDNKEHPITINNVSLNKKNLSLEHDDPRKIIYLNLTNFNELYERLRIDKAQKAHTLPGFLELYQPDKHLFYITESLPSSEWQELINHIENYYPNKQFDFIISPHANIENYSIPDTTDYYNGYASKNYFNVSNDPDYSVNETIKDEMKYGFSQHINVVDISTETTFTDLIAKIRLNHTKNSAKVSFQYEETDLVKWLQDPEQLIIFNGEMSPELYQQLLPIFSSSPHLMLNGEAIEVKAEVISIQPFSAKQKLNLTTRKSIFYDKDYYLAQFDQQYQNTLHDIFYFYAIAGQLSHHGDGRPNPPVISYALLKRMLNAIHGKSLHPENPIKGLFNLHYPKESNDYAFLNTLAKYLFYKKGSGKSLKEYKLKQTLTQCKIKTIGDLTHNLWKVLNCFSGEELNQLIGYDIHKILDLSKGFPTLDPNFIKIVWQIIEPYIHNQKSVAKPIKNHVAKREAQLAELLNNPEQFLIIAKGEPGVGKTHSVKKLKNNSNFTLYDGLPEIVNWLNDKSPEKKVLLLDEANMAKPGTWDFLKGLSRNGRTVFYLGKEYPLSEHHKIIATCNPENFPLRYHHQFFQHYGEVIKFCMPDEDFLEKEVLTQILSPAGQPKCDPIIAKNILFAYHLICKLNPTFGYSTRDIESCAQRFLNLRHYLGNDQLALLEACVGEFAGTITKSHTRDVFIKELSQHLNVVKKDHPDEMIYITPTCPIPKEKAYLVDAIEQDLLIRRQAMNHPGDYFYKRGVLIEGDAGLGKSYLLKSLLHKNGFRSDAIDPKERYYEISVSDGDDAVKQTLLKAFHEGSVVILDELNLSEEIEEILNQLLTGEDLNHQKPNQQGFMVLASQNPSSYEGRKATSRALRNRMYVEYMDPYSLKALTTIADSRQIKYPAAFSRAFQKCQILYKDIANVRTYYTGVEVESSKKNPP